MYLLCLYGLYIHNSMYVVKTHSIQYLVVTWCSKYLRWPNKSHNNTRRRACLFSLKMIRASNLSHIIYYYFWLYFCWREASTSGNKREFLFNMSVILYISLKYRRFAACQANLWDSFDTLLYARFWSSFRKSCHINEFSVCVSCVCYGIE